MYIIARYIFMVEVIWETLIDGKNYPGWLYQVKKIVLEYETSLVNNLWPFVIKESLLKFHQNFLWDFKYTLVYI